MTKAIGLYLVLVSVLWFTLLTLGVEFDTKEKIQIGGGFTIFLLVLEAGVYLLNGGF